MQRPISYTAMACFAGLSFITMTSTALGTGDLVVRTFALLCAFASVLTVEATWMARSNAVRAVIVLGITAIVFGVSIIFYAQNYPLESDILTVANASLASGILLEFIAGFVMPRRRAPLRKVMRG